MRRLVLVLSTALLAGTVAAVLQATPAAAATPTIVTGTGDGTPPRVRTFDAAGAPVADRNAASGNSQTGARVATGDVNGDGVDEVIVAGGPGSQSFVTVYPSTNNFPTAGFSPYGSFGGGVFVAAGDVDGDGHDEVIASAGSGGGSHVRVWDLEGTFQISEKLGFFAYDPAFRGGASVAVAHVVGSSRADIVTGAGPGGGPHVKIFDVSSGTAMETGGWFAYSPAFTGGVRVAAGVLGSTMSIVTGAGAGGGPHVRAFTTAGAERTGFFAYAPGFGGGVNVAVGDADSDGRGEIVTAPASGGGPHVRVFEDNGSVGRPEFFAFEPSMTAGVFVATFKRAPTSSTTQNGGSNSSSSGGNP